MTDALSPGDNKLESQHFTQQLHPPFNWFIPVNKLVTVNLDDSNYLTWKQQLLTAIRAHGLKIISLEHLLFLCNLSMASLVKNIII